MTARTLGRCAMLVMLLLVLWPFRADAQLVPYEIWDSGQIRSDRWRGDEDFGGQEVRREVGDLVGRRHKRGDDAALRAGRGQSAANLRYRLDGFLVGGQPAGTFGASNRLNFSNPGSIDSIAVNLTVEELTLVPCAANNAGAITRARAAQILLARFNDGSSTGAGDRTGDIFAGIQAQRDGSSGDPESVMNVVAFINRITAPNGSSVTLNALTLGQVRVGDTFRLLVSWDQGHSRFLVRLNGGPLTPLPYSVSDVAPAALPFANIGQSHSVANCNAERASIVTTTLVGNVSTNASAVIP